MAKGKTLVSLADQKCEIFSYEEFNDGVYMRLCFQNANYDPTTKTIQHFKWDHEGSNWAAVEPREAKMYKKGDFLTKNAAFVKAVLNEDRGSLAMIIATSVLGENFMPPAPMAVAQEHIDFEDLEY